MIIFLCVWSIDASPDRQQQWTLHPSASSFPYLSSVQHQALPRQRQGERHQGTCNARIEQSGLSILDRLDWRISGLREGALWWGIVLCVQVELYRMVRQFHLRTQGGHETSTSHPDIIGDRWVINRNQFKKTQPWWIFILSLDVSARVWRYVPSTASFWRTSWECVAVYWASWTSAPLPSDARPAGYLPWEINILLNLGTHRWESPAFASRVNGWSCHFKDSGKSNHTQTQQIPEKVDMRILTFSTPKGPRMCLISIWHLRPNLLCNWHGESAMYMIDVAR